MINIRGLAFELFLDGCHLELVIQHKKSQKAMSMSLDKRGLHKWLISSLCEVPHLTNGRPTGGFLPHKTALEACCKAFENGGRL